MKSPRILESLQTLADPERAKGSAKYLQAYPGGYGEGDQFLGISVPNIRLVAKRFRDMGTEELESSLKSQWHECRLAAVFVLEHKYRKSTAEGKTELLQLYLDHLDYMNNWDLVDSSSPKILGVHLLDNPSMRKLLTPLARSGKLWRERTAVVATMPLIKNSEFSDILKLCKYFLNHHHDLIHKATGWMLRDVGDVDNDVLHGFLEKHTPRMPRTMLRYAIEHQTASVKKHFMGIPRA